MKNILLSFVLLFVFYLTFISPVHAGGGRVLIYNVSRGVAGTSPSYFSAQVFKHDIMSADFSVGERFEVRIENPRNGDKCFLNSERTSDIGMLTGTCEATTPGEYLMYLYSLDLENESSRHYVYFDKPILPSPKVTPLPTKSPSPKPSLTPSPTSKPTPTQTPWPSPTLAATKTIQEDINNVGDSVVEAKKQNIVAQIIDSILRLLGLRK